MTSAAAAARSMGGVLVIGIGNPDRGDDGAGLAVLRRLEGRVPPAVTLLARRGDMLALIDDWAGRDAVILVDAAVRLTGPGVAPPRVRPSCATGPHGTPGRIDRIDLLAEPLPPDLALASTHAFGVAEAIGLARALGLLPRRLVAYAIEGASFDPGASLSPSVAAAADQVATRIAAECTQLLLDPR